MEVAAQAPKPPAGDRPLFQGTADQVVADIRAYADAGVTHFVFDHTIQDLRAVLENLERFAHDVRPKLEAASVPRGRCSAVAGPDGAWPVRSERREPPVRRAAG